MNYKILIRTYLLFLAFVCISPFSMAFEGAQAEEDEPEKGPHRGRMLRQGDFALELSIFETGVPPELECSVKVILLWSCLFLKQVFLPN